MHRAVRKSSERRATRELLLVGQGVDVHVEAGRWRIDFRRDGVWNQPRASAAPACGHNNVLLAVDGERDRESLDSRCEFLRPQHLAVLRIDRLELLIAIADEHKAAAS